jgi:serine/threonine protein kinase
VKQAKPGNEDSMSALRSEIASFKQIGSHPSIVTVVGSSDAPLLVLDRADYALNDPQHTAVVPFPKRLQMVRGVIDAVATMHGKEWVHADINTKNVLVKGDAAKLTDFGAAKEADAPTPKPGWWDEGELGPYVDPTQPGVRGAERKREDRRATAQLAYNVIMGVTTDSQMPADWTARISSPDSPVPADKKELLIGILTKYKDGNGELRALSDELSHL